MTTIIQVSNVEKEGVRHVRLIGEVVRMALKETFDKVYGVLGDLQNAKIVFDLSELHYINSEFIGYLAELYSSLDQKGGKMVIMASEDVLDTLGLVRFTDLVAIVKSYDEGVETLRGHVSIPNRELLD